MTAIVRRGAILLGFLGVAAVGLREVVNSSTFQLFGDYVARVDTQERVVACCLQNILPELTSRGYRFETVSTLVGRRPHSR